MLDDWKGVLTGSPDALESLYASTYHDLFAYGVMLGHPREAVKDGIQYLFLSIWEKRDRLPQVSSVKPYLFTWLRRILNEKKDHQTTFPIAPHLEASADSQEDIIIRAELARETWQQLLLGMEQLTPKQKQAIQLRYFDKLSYDEIADRTQNNVRTIYNLVSEALKVLKKKVKNNR